MGFFKNLFGGKGKKNEGSTKQRDANIVDVRSGDDSMNWAMEKSRLTLNYFKKCLAHPKPGQNYFSVKVKFEDRGKVEYIWLTEPHFDGDGNLFGTVGNEPRDVGNVKLNQKVGVEESIVSDWMIFENGYLVGGYTIRAIRNGIPANQRANFDRSLGGVIVDEGEDWFEVNRETPEGAIMGLEAAYAAKNLDQVLTFKNFNKEAEFLLKKKGLAGKPELVESTGEMLKLAFIGMMQEQGFPKIEHVKRAFPLREKITDHHYLITEVCTYADGGKSLEKLNTYKMDDGWVVMLTENANS